MRNRMSGGVRGRRQKPPPTRSAQDDFLISVTVIGKDKEVPPVKVTMDASYLLHLQHALNNN